MFCYKIKLDGQFIGDSNATYRGTDIYGHEEVCISYVFDIGENNIEFGKIPSWNTNKSIEVWVRDFSTTTEVWLHKLYYLDGTENNNRIVKPRIEIQAIGQSSPQGAILPTAASDTLGGIKVGTNLSIDSYGVLSSTDTNTTYTGGTGITLSSTTFNLDTASTSALGGVKVDGSTITIDGSGVISSSPGYTLPTATDSILGGVKVDGSTITINGSGVISSSGSNLSSSSINDLSDISFDTSSITNGQSLVWNSTNSRWEAGDVTTTITNTSTTVTSGGGWVNKNATNTPSFDYFGDIIYDGNDGIYFVAGRENSNNNTVRNGVWKYTLSTNTWGQITTSGTFHSSLLEHAVVFYNNAIYVFGGWNRISNNNDLYKLDLSQTTPSWSLVSTSGTAPVARQRSFCYII